MYKRVFCTVFAFKCLSQKALFLLSYCLCGYLAMLISFAICLAIVSLIRLTILTISFFRCIINKHLEVNEEGIDICIALSLVISYAQNH